MDGFGKFIKLFLLGDFSETFLSVIFGDKGNQELDALKFTVYY